MWKRIRQSPEKDNLVAEHSIVGANFDVIRNFLREKKNGELKNPLIPVNFKKITS